MAKNILIADDSATMRKIIMDGRQQAGIEQALGRAGGAVDGLESQAVGSFDLILSDIDAPNLNGLDFVKAITPKVPTPPPDVTVTTAGGEAAVKEAMARGADGHLQKPFTPEKVQEVIGPFLK